MKLIERYPTVAMFLSFFVSSCVFAYLPQEAKIVIACAAVAFILLCIFLFRGRLIGLSLTKSLILILSAVMISSCISLYYFNVYADRINECNTKEDSVVLEIKEQVYSLSYTSRYVAEVRESSMLKTGTKILLNTELGYVEDGTILSGRVIYSSLESLSNGAFDGKRYYLSKRIMIIADDTNLTAVGFDNSFDIGRFFGRINRRLTSMLVAHCGYESGGFASAVLLGNKDYLADSIERDFDRLGITHLLVVSGTHFSIIVALLDITFKKTRVKRKTRALINIAVILFMMGITGFSPSVVRAGVMHLLAQFSILLFKRANMINSFAIAGTLLILINPYAPIDCGLQLSFLATYSCIMFQTLKGSFYRSLREKHGIRLTGGNRLKRFIVSCVETVALTTLITLSTMPIVWLYFGEISLISVPANVIFIPLVTLFIYLTVAYLLLYPLVVFVTPLSFCISGFTDVLQRLAGLISSGKWVMLSIDYDFSVYFLIPIAALFVILPVVQKKARSPILICSLSLCVLFFATVFTVRSFDSKNVRLSYITEKKNDGFVIKANGDVLIADISDASYSFASNMLHEAEEMHVCEIEYLLLTHYHNKHISLLARISDKEILRCVILPEPIDKREENIFTSLCELAESCGIDVIVLPVNGSFFFGDALITLSERTYIKRSTHPITALSIEINDEKTVILSGAFNEAGEDIVSLARDADTVIFGVHSPVYKKSFGISQIGDPKVMIVSDDAYKHMDEELKEYADSHPMRLGSGSYRQVVKSGE